jgi:hypothetical protein
MSELSRPDDVRPAAVEDLHGLLERARQGDLGVLPRLCAVLDGCPEIWNHFGDLARHAER